MTVLPYAVAFFAIAFYALLSPLAKKIGPDLQPFSFIACSSFILFVVAAALSFVFERHKFSAMITKVEWPWLAAFSLANIVAYAGYLWAINRIPVVHYEMMISITPIIAGVFALILLGEPLHLRYLPALGFIIIGLLIAVKPWSN